MRARILCAGSINADFEMRVDGDLTPGATHVAHDLLATSGGKAANRAVLACRLGHEALLTGCVGRDVRADQALAGPRHEGVDLSGVRAVEGLTAVAALLVRPDGRKTTLLVPNANDAFGEPEAEHLMVACAEAPPCSVLAIDLEVSPEPLRPALRAARVQGVVTVVDPSPAGRATDELLALADHLTPNAREAAALVGAPVDSERSALRAARALRERGAGAVHVKLPDGGAAVASPDGDGLVSVPPLPVIDETGAGDAFAGALAVAVAERRPALEAARVAVAAASCAIARYGSQQSYPSRGVLAVMLERVHVRSVS